MDPQSDREPAGAEEPGRCCRKAFPPWWVGWRGSRIHELKVGAQRRLCGRLEGGGVFTWSCTLSLQWGKSERGGSSWILKRRDPCSPSHIHPLLPFLVHQLPLQPGATSLSLLLHCLSLRCLLRLPAAIQPALAEASGLVVVSLKDTELSFYVTLFKCLIKLNLA